MKRIRADCPSLICLLKVQAGEGVKFESLSLGACQKIVSLGGVGSTMLNRFYVGTPLWIGASGFVLAGPFKFEVLII